MLKINSDIYLHESGGVFLRDISSFVIADLHLGIEAAAGINVGMQEKEMEERMEKIIEELKVKRVILNGDIKHTFGKDNPQQWEDVRRFVEKIKEKAGVIAIKGNHDFYIKNILKEENIYEVLKEERYIITHGHLDVYEKGFFHIIGNEHPMLKIRDEVGAKIELKCFLFFRKEKILVLPAFNPLVKGSNVLEGEFLSPMLKKVDKEKGEIYAINEDEILFFGEMGKLRNLF